MARAATEDIRSRNYVELLHEPDLSVVVFRRLGWTPAQYADWSDRLMRANFAFVQPTVHDGETVDAVRDREPAHDGGGHLRHPRHHGLNRLVCSAA